MNCVKGLEVAIHRLPKGDNTTIRNNRGEQGGNIALTITGSGMPLSEPIIKISNSLIERGMAKNGGGLRFWSRPTKKNTSITWTGTSIHKIFHVYNTTFRSNSASSTGGAIYMIYYQSKGFDCIAKRLILDYASLSITMGMVLQWR
jgi:hypothetical protein